ncbi:MAG: efflux RND transporter permease subunit [Bacteroidota bacterium]|nr:MAG: efflux RND transporter permease subunit [Bacteroidota bacterium]
MEKKFKEFWPTSWAIDNKVSIYMLTIIIAIFGALSYKNIPKEQIPEIIIPTVFVTTIYPGASPVDIENLVTRPLEKELKSIRDVKKVSSKSVQDFSMISVEFTTKVEITEAKQRVKDAIDKAADDLPNDLPADPEAAEINFADMPIQYINLSGDYSLSKIKEYAEMLQDQIEELPEITRVDIVGALDREIQVDVDMYKMQAASVTFYEIQNAISYENMTISGGNIDMQGLTRSVRVVGEFNDIETIKNISFISSSGAIVKLKDIAEVKDSHKKQESYSRMNGKNVITLNVIKKSGENLLDASEKIAAILKDARDTKIPNDLNVDITGDQSKYTRLLLFDLNNTIIFGFILVFIVLMFFMGVTNAFFVGLSIPLAMALSYILLPGLDFTMNMLVMFSFIFALGIVVDDAIVVIENTHRIFKAEKLDIKTAAKKAAGEVFMPILSGTLTTLAPFFPLTFWPGVVGDFMFYIPITIILALLMSLVVAYIINPVFAVDFMAHQDETQQVPNRKIYRTGLIVAGAGVFLHLFRLPFLANLTLFFALSYVLHNKWGYKVLLKFQHKIIPGILNEYEKVLRWILQKRRPKMLVWSLVVLLILSFIIYGASKPQLVFFPDNEPNIVHTYIKLPVGTDVKYTDSIASIVENKIMKVIGPDNKIVESVITNVAINASSDWFDAGTKSHLAKVTVNFVEFAKRHGESTNKYLEDFRVAVKDIPGAEISVEKEAKGPPTGAPVNLEISGEDMELILATTDKLIQAIDSAEIPGLDKMQSKFENNKPELVINIDRDRANREGISTAQIGNEIRTAINGVEVSKYRDGEDQYPIQLRYNEYQRENIDRLMNLKITYRDMNTGLLRQIPLSSVASVEYVSTYGGINRISSKRVVTVVSNIFTGHSSPEVNIKIQKLLNKIDLPEGIEVSLTGETEDQKETGAFLGKAFLFAMFLVLFILITQFNSTSKPFIILTEVIFSVSGVLLGLAIFRMPFSMIMNGMGLVALSGIVVRNGILLVEFTDVLKERGMKTREAIIMGGKTRITPVILTAVATILGLIPLCIGLNVDFVGLFRDFSPNIHLGSDSSLFFKSLGWTIIFGLSFATFLTLIFIPVMYYMFYIWKLRIKRRKFLRKLRTREVVNY